MIEQGTGRFVSRKHQPLSGFQMLGEPLVKEMRAQA
jgi:hypothetical protein